ncbi:hypothetical protein AB0P15_09220 [Streptomyces sp. NPDC087917]|uniref:hypothetical protein n=1 Tax=Streptomyces sp. NPDC087917 TaxID=3155060 RepID=UPI0034384AEE
MSHEAVPETPRQTGPTGVTAQAAHEGAPRDSAVPPQADAPKGLLQQMEELLEALNADLSQLDADLQLVADRMPPATLVAPAGLT